jgi:hypothetical protein
MSIIVTTTTPTPSAAIDIEWLAQNCYIQFAHEDREYRNGSWHKEENENEVAFRTVSVRSAIAAGLTG